MKVFRLKESAILQRRAVDVSVDYHDMRTTATKERREKEKRETAERKGEENKGEGTERGEGLTRTSSSSMPSIDALRGVQAEDLCWRGMLNRESVRLRIA